LHEGLRWRDCISIGYFDHESGNWNALRHASCIFQACMKGFAGATAFPSVVLVTNQEIGPRSGRAGPSFSARPEKEAKGAVLHGTAAAGR